MTPSNKPDIDDILEGIYNRAADNNGNYLIWYKDAPDYTVEEAKQALYQMLLSVIGGDETTISEYGKEYATREQKLRNDLRKELAIVFGVKK